MAAALQEAHDAGMKAAADAASKAAAAASMAAQNADNKPKEGARRRSLSPASRRLTEHGGGGYGGLGTGEEDAVVRIRGLPFSASLTDIATFFDGFGVAERGVQLVPGKVPSRPSGEAYVEFTTTDGAKRALAKNREMMGSRYLEVYAATRTEMMIQLEESGGGGGYGDGGGYGRGGGGGGHRYEPYGGGPPGRGGGGGGLSLIHI